MMEMKKITTLFLDIGGVLLSNGWGHVFRHQAAKKFNLDIPEMEDRHGLMFVTFEEGKITMEEYLNRVVFYKQRDFTQSVFREFMFSLTTPDGEMIALLKKLKKQYGLKIVAVSNEARELNEFRINRFKLNEWIDFFVSSCYVQIRKPDAAIFTLALDLAHVAADEVLYIDDVQMFVDVATDLGIKSILHTSYLSTATALQNNGISIAIK
ncbi:MAG: HAD family phosphatase [Ferruginibacter sp.]|nr:HAD family phosphatase [Ferruginibacter sp.]